MDEVDLLPPEFAPFRFHPHVRVAREHGAPQIRSAEEAHLPEPEAAVTLQIQSAEEPAQEGQAKAWIGIALAVLIVLLIFGSMALNGP